MKKCSVSGCLGKVDARGFCSSHYERWRRHGDPFGGRTGKGEVALYLRNKVLPYEGDDCILWPYAKDLNGYPVIGGMGRQRKVTRIVCENKTGPVPSSRHQAAHSCGNGHRGCVTPSHLRWATPSENAQDKFKHGTQVCGEAFSGSRLTAEQVITIRGSLLSTKDVAAEFGITLGNVRHIRSRRTWKWL